MVPVTGHLAPGEALICKPRLKESADFLTTAVIPAEWHAHSTFQSTSIHQKKVPGQAVVAHAFNPRTGEAEAGKFL